MIFSRTWELILQGDKTQTRRIVKAGERLLADHRDLPDEVLRRDATRYERLKWQVGRTYAVQPGRGKSAMGRIRLTGIRRERLHQASVNDIIAEGFGVWHGEDHKADLAAFANAWDTLHVRAGTRWQDNPDVWVLEFELIAPKEKT